ncbi:MAG: hypothetical protein ACE5GK_05905 [Nitrospiria bacterium]
MDSFSDRRSEWFVPRFGPLKFRVFVGLLFLPYTGMVLAYAVLGSMLAKQVYWDRVAAIGLIYFLGLGLSAHALDAIGGRGKTKPWGNHFSRKTLWTIAVFALIPAYAIGIYYILFWTPWLVVVALLEGFFLFAYNLEWFDGRFHTDAWFAFSWGVLPVLGGFIIQTNTLSPSVCALAGAMGLFSLVEINASRPYKEIKRSGEKAGQKFQKRYEQILKGISLGVILLAMALVCFRLGL